MSFTPQTTCQFVELYYSSLNCPRALTCYLMFKYNEHEQLVKLETNPKDYISPEDFRLSYLATKFLSKSTFLSTKIDKKSVAMEKFRMAEADCQKINHRGYHWMTVKKSFNTRLHNAIVRKIDTILGEFYGEEMIELANWGPGVTLKVKGSDTSSVNKFRLENGTTRPLDHLMGHLYAVAYPIWDLSKREIQDWNKVITVPKNSKTDRTIAVEPGLNLWFQKGVGQMIRRRLRRFGLNLNTQDRNQALSKAGSLTNNLATVDFSSASDTIAYSTVRELLPNRWFQVMDVLRSQYGLIDNKITRYEKFSSMGNGFTFELESLIFYAVAVSVCEYLHVSTMDVSVYGDDVIIPVSGYRLFKDACEFYGFTINQEKSFFSGDFRESCGAHWYLGRNCKPYYFKELIISDINVYLAANSVRRLSRDLINRCCDNRFYFVWLYLRKLVNKPCLISEGFGDGGFISNFDEARPSRMRNGIEGYRTHAITATPIRYQSDDHSVLLARLKGGNSLINLNNWVSLRARVKLSRKRLFIPHWCDLGPWL